jgi:hypothetical protein
LPGQSWSTEAAEEDERAVRSWVFLPVTAERYGPDQGTNTAGYAAVVQIGNTAPARVTGLDSPVGWLKPLHSHWRKKFIMPLTLQQQMRGELRNLSVAGLVFNSDWKAMASLRFKIHYLEASRGSNS